MDERVPQRSFPHGVETPKVGDSGVTGTVPSRARSTKIRVGVTLRSLQTSFPFGGGSRSSQLLEDQAVSGLTGHSGPRGSLEMRGNCFGTCTSPSSAFDGSPGPAGEFRPLFNPGERSLIPSFPRQGCISRGSPGPIFRFCVLLSADLAAARWPD